MSSLLPVDDRLPPLLLEAIAARGGTRSFPANTILINEGDSTDSLYLVLSGRVKAYSSADNGREVVLDELGPGEYLGELSLDGERRSVSVKTLTPTTCCIVQGAELRQFLTEHPDFAVHLTHKLIRMVRRLTEQVKSLMEVGTVADALRAAGKPLLTPATARNIKPAAIVNTSMITMCFRKAE